MIRAENSVVINRPVEEVFAFLASFEKIPQWRSAVLESSQTSEGAVGVGTRYREVARYLGRRKETTAEVTEYEPNRKLGVKVEGTPLGSVQATYTLSAVDGGTRVDTSGQAEPDGFFKLVQPLVRAMARKQMDADNARLKRLLEAGA